MKLAAKRFAKRRTNRNFGVANSGIKLEFGIRVQNRVQKAPNRRRKCDLNMLLQFLYQQYASETRTPEQEVAGSTPAGRTIPFNSLRKMELGPKFNCDIVLHQNLTELFLIKVLTSKIIRRRSELCGFEILAQ